MYELYLQQCCTEKITAVRKSMYYRIFVTESNLGFHSPKSDRCDLCEKFEVSKQTQTLTDDIKYEYDVHQTSKMNIREVRNEEKKNKDLPLLLFYLQNVIPTAHVNISPLFYLRKLNLYNLTAYYTPTKQVYCALWSENLSGRAGNDIASAFHKILTVLTEENGITELITWSNSCIPQNRNSIISNTVLHFLKDNPQVKSVTMKYSLPGHSCVREVYSVHSNIEKAINKINFYSPIGLIRILKQVNPRHPYRVRKMRPDDFKDFQRTANLLIYKIVPFTIVEILKFSVNFKASHDKLEPENSSNIKFAETSIRGSKIY
ncbi:hypothetical protein AVEN_54621-1 [Araneus ventricosus]|uniref:Uncharacterized protein n=1 Tax=Araneus ventricosus TaxID=182803 RepID=A0A4Y2BL49_ARAVE|nr:hypothetical protein AVEN_54621-1 [Araneus ventricosus]